MKTFITVAVVACVAMVIFEISQTDAQRRTTRTPAECEAGRKPALNTTAVTCDRVTIFNRRNEARCCGICRRCYRRDQLLVRPGSCLVGGKCQCLGRPSNSTGTTAAAGAGTTTTAGAGTTTAGAGTTTSAPATTAGSGTTAASPGAESTTRSSGSA